MEGLDRVGLAALGASVVHEAVLVAHFQTEADAAALIEVWRAFREAHGDAIRWQSDGSGRWKRATASLWARFESRVGGPPSRRVHAWHLHNAESADSRGPAAPALDLLASEGTVTLRWIEAEDRVPWEELCARLPLIWGYAGVGLYGPTVSDATRGRHDAVGDALLADPWLGQTHPLLWGALTQGVCHLAPRLALGPTYAERTGLPATLTLASSDEARELWRRLEPVRLPDDRLRGLTWVPGLTLPEMAAWATRWAPVDRSPVG
ncbi:MAG: hypothetical protein KC621_31830 [Myxococcales bacterium]|nr:hypothetical protein [Myxococcales bacterium]